MTTDNALEISGLHAYYGESHVLHGIDIHVRRGELVTLLGRNGSGRSSTIRSIMGLVGRRVGSIRIAGQETIGMPPHRIARLGVGWCPEERGIFSTLSTEENLALPPRARGEGLSIDELFEMFPNLKERRNSPGTKLSGGEQQMLAIARVLRTGADILVLDEITEGLAPVIVKRIGEVVRKLKSLGYTMLLAEQNFVFAAPLADRHYVIEEGHVVMEVAHHELEAKMGKLNELLGV
ncbi:MAG: ABC transporter ATP-binding protein [Xanthobacteraceae bacterium]|nr:MAG: ABC transporter ATP-binding protein [Xanthobacteraceae bacterium]